MMKVQTVQFVNWDCQVVLIKKKETNYSTVYKIYNNTTITTITITKPYSQNVKVNYGSSID